MTLIQLIYDIFKAVFLDIYVALKDYIYIVYVSVLMYGSLYIFRYFRRKF